MKFFDRSFTNKIKKDNLISDFGDSLTDITNYRPDPSEARNRLLSAIGQSAGQGVYDFKDGNIDVDLISSKYWSYLLALKRKDLDITEVEQIRDQLQKDFAENLDKDRLKEIFEKDPLPEAAEQKSTDNPSAES